MADKEQNPATQANGHAWSDAEAAAAAHDSRELRKKKRTRCLLYIILFAIFQTGVILIFALTIMKVRTPKFRVHSGGVENLNTGSTSNPSLSRRLTAELGVKNANFGRYKYQNTTVVFLYGGTKVGEAAVSSSRVGWRSTKKFNVVVDLNLAGGGPGNEQLASDLSSGVVRLTSQAKMRGKVELIFVMKKNKSTDMNCTMELLTAAQQLRNIRCK
jgi:hypothetical protein